MNLAAILSMSLEHPATPAPEHLNRPRVVMREPEEAVIDDEYDLERHREEYDEEMRLQEEEHATLGPKHQERLDQATALAIARHTWVETTVSSYVPFDPHSALREAKALPKDERKEAYEIIRHATALQQQGIALILSDLRLAVTDPHDLDGTFPSSDELLALVGEQAPHYRLSSEQLNLIRKGILTFMDRLKAIEDNKEEPAEEIFERAFGRKPQGRVLLSSTPLSLHLDCFDHEDYLIADTYAKTGGDKRKITNADRMLSKLSLGQSLSVTKDKELEDILCVYAPRPEVPRRVTTKVEFATLNETRTLDFSQITGRVIITSNETSEALWWAVMAMEPGSSPSCMIVRNDKTTLLVDEGQTATLLSEEGGNLAITPLGQTLRIDDATAAGMTVNYLISENKPKGPVPEPLDAQHIIVHEDTHKFNHLFTPLYAIKDTADIVFACVQKTDDPEQLKPMLAAALLRRSRRATFDLNARNEILAYYADGTQPSDIADTLACNPLYDYYQLEPDTLHEAIVSAKEEIAKNAEVIMPSQDGETRTPLEISEEDIAALVKQVFKDEYLKNLYAWPPSLPSWKRPATIPRK